MAKKKILMVAPNYWDSPFQVGSHHFAKGFVKNGWEVAYISDPISLLHPFGGLSPELKERYNLYRSGGKFYYDHQLWTYVPGALLTPHNKPFLRTKWILENWQRLTFPNILKKVSKMGFSEPDFLYFDSTLQPFWLNKIKYARSILRLADNNMGFEKSTPATKKIENYLIQSVDTVIYSGTSLKDYIRKMEPKKMVHIPNGVDFDHFLKAQRTLPQDFEKFKKPIAIYVGAMDAWFDFELLNKAAENLPSISFVLIGPHKLAKNRLKKLPNIYLLGRKNYDEIPAYMHNSDVGLIPFNVGEYPKLVNNIHPLKLYEYMACGLPVVSTRWDELTALESPAILCDDPKSFSEAIIKSLESRSQSQQETNINFARRNDWKLRTENLIENVLS